jgi:hypothetical protein
MPVVAIRQAQQGDIAICPPSPALRGYGVALSTEGERTRPGVATTLAMPWHFRRRRKWWRRWESNPRPKWSHFSFYACVLPFILVQLTADRRAIRETSVHELFRLGARSHNTQTNLLSSSRSAQQVSAAKRHGLIRPRELIQYQHLCFFRKFNEANRSPRRATAASTKPSKPVRPHISKIKGGY